MASRRRRVVVDETDSEPWFSELDEHRRCIVDDYDSEGLCREIINTRETLSDFEEERLTTRRHRGLKKSGKSDRTDTHEPVIDIHDNGKNATIHLTADVQIDLSEDVADLARLNRLGWFKQGVTLYEERLKNHLDSFPVAVEYADLLLQQGEYKAALSFTEKCCALYAKTENYALDEYMVLESMNAYAAIFAAATIGPALKALEGMSKFLRREKVESLKATKIHMVELYLQISVFIKDNIREDLLPPTIDFREIKFRKESWYFMPMTLSCGYYFGDWYHLLQKQGFYWESFRFLRLVLAILETEDLPLQHLGAVFHMNGSILDLEDAFLPLGQIASCDDEQLILAELAITSLIGHFVTEVSRHPNAIELCWHRERSLVRLITDDHPHLSTSRSFLEWVLKENVCISTFQTQMAAQLRGGIPRLVTQKRRSIRPLLSQLLEVGSIQKALGKGHVESIGSIQKVLKCSEESGDTLLQRTALQELIMFTGNTVSNRLKSLTTLARLLDTVDLVGYIDYLVIKYTVLEEITPHISPDTQAAEKLKLCEEIQRFSSRYPWNVGFSLPLSEYIKERILKGLKSRLPYNLKPGQRPSIITGSEADESDIGEEDSTRWCGKYLPRTVDDGEKRLALPCSRSPISVGDPTTDGAQGNSSSRRIDTIISKPKKRDVYEVEGEAWQIEKSNRKSSARKSHLGSSLERKDNAYTPMFPSPSETEEKSKRPSDKSKFIQGQERYSMSVAPPDGDTASQPKLNRQPTIEAASDSENQNREMPSAKEQEYW